MEQPLGILLRYLEAKSHITVMLYCEEHAPKLQMPVPVCQTSSNFELDRVDLPDEICRERRR
jgi:hypothetical protein